MPSTHDDDQAALARQQADAELLTILVERVEHAEDALGSYRKALTAQRDLWRRGEVSGFDAVTTADTASIALTAFRDAGELIREWARAINQFFGRSN